MLIFFSPCPASNSIRAVELEQKLSDGGTEGEAGVLVPAASELYKSYNGFKLSMNRTILEPETKAYRCWSRSWSQKL